MKKQFWMVLLVFCCANICQAQSCEKATKGNQEITVKLFPNPATSVINVLGLKDTEKASIQVSDSYGNMVLQHAWEIKNNALNIPVANLEKGMYILFIVSPEQRLHTKFYKQ